MTFKVGSTEVIQRPLRPCEDDPNYDNPDSIKTTLPKGHRKDPAYAAFQADTIFEKDVKIPLRDGSHIRADIFRPADEDQKVPALVAWSPYGKSGRGRGCPFVFLHLHHFAFALVCSQIPRSQENLLVSEQRWLPLDMI